MGCWAIGGPFWDGQTPLGWGEVDDAVDPRHPCRWTWASPSSIRPTSTARGTASACSGTRLPGAAPGRDRHQVQRRLRRGHAPGDRLGRDARRASARPARTRCAAGDRLHRPVPVPRQRLPRRRGRAGARHARSAGARRARSAPTAGAPTFRTSAESSPRGRTAPPSSSSSTCWTTTRRSLRCASSTTWQPSTAVRWRWAC